MKADELIKKILNKEIVSGTGIRVITPTYSTEYYFWGNWFGTKDGDKPLDNIELHLCDSHVTFEIIEERPEEIEEIELGKVTPNGEYIISENDEKIQNKINELIKEVNLLKKEEKKDKGGSNG